jgi:hypothetical protein
MENGDAQQLSIRGDGKIPLISIEAECLAEAAHKTIIACHDYGCRIETPKQKPGMPLGRDANIIVRINNPDSDPKVYFPGFHDTGEGLMQYILEVTHGIHDHWKKTPENPERWGYTYHERFIDQIPFVMQRIKHDWEKKKGEWHNGNGRPTGRDYQFAIWRAGEDIILEQPDAPCWQLGQIRLLQDSDGNMVMNYATNWRSRDLLKAWNQNNIAQVELMKCFRDKIRDMLQVPVKLGCYIDHSDSLHLYGLYYQRDGLEKQIEQMKGYTNDEDLIEKTLERFDQSDLTKKQKVWIKRTLKNDKDVAGFMDFIRDKWLSLNYREKSRGLDDFFMAMTGKDATGLKRYIAAQGDAEMRGHGLNQGEDTLKQLGYNLETIKYPKAWDSYDPKFDAAPDITKLARVC